MSVNYLIDNNNEFGLVSLNPGVFETITSITIKEVKNLELTDGNTFYNPITCRIKDNEISLSADIRVNKGIKVIETTEQLQNKIFNAILQMTDIKVSKIDIKVVGFIF